MNLPYISPLARYGQPLHDYAVLFRKLALRIDHKPEDIMNYCEEPALQMLLHDRHGTTLMRTQYLEAFAYGDPGVLLACPGPSLSGLIMRELEPTASVDEFYDFMQTWHTRTFFALTEPTKGSDANALVTKLTPTQTGNFILTGEKCLCGNGAVADIGVVFARVNTGPLGIRAILLRPKQLIQSGTIERYPLPMTGLRGAQLAYIRFNQCPIPKEQVLGEQKGYLQNGMLAIVKTFNRLRTGVGALAIGQAQAVLDHVYENKSNWQINEKQTYTFLYNKLAAVRKLLHQAALAVEQNPLDQMQVSIAKWHATHLAETVITTSIDLLPPYHLLHNEWLAKCYRDCFAWEYMEGTSDMQLKHIYQGTLKQS